MSEKRKMSKDSKYVMWSYDSTNNFAISSDYTYNFTEEENRMLCTSFELLDVNGDGIINKAELNFPLMAMGRLPFNDELAEVMIHACDWGEDYNKTGMNYEGFREYIIKQIKNTTSETELREAFQVFDTTPPTGKLNVRKFRHILKHKGLKLTDDEIDFLFKEDYWLLEETDLIEIDKIVDKILLKPSIYNPFLDY